MEVVGVEQLEAEEGKNDLKRERATIYKVTIEQLNSVVKHYDAQFLDLRGHLFKDKHYKLLPQFISCFALTLHSGGGMQQKEQ